MLWVDHRLTIRIFDVNYTPTADFVLSASEDGNVRIWKSNASDKIGPVSTKERQAIEYRRSLVDRWSSVKDVRSVKDRRHVPESIHNATKLKREMIEARKVKEDRRRKHTRAGKEKPKAERKSESRRWHEMNSELTPGRGCHHRTEVDLLGESRRVWERPWERFVMTYLMDVYTKLSASTSRWVRQSAGPRDTSLPVLSSSAADALWTFGTITGSYPRVS